MAVRMRSYKQIQKENLSKVLPKTTIGAWRRKTVKFYHKQERARKTDQR
jgi:hypothetical protein